MRKRAGDRCEYCLVHQYTRSAVFHVDHVIPVNKGGETRIENLALACPHCDRQKWDRTEALDPATGTVVLLYNPRTQRWADHLRFRGHRVVGLTATGRATVEALLLNHPPKVRVREIEGAFGLFPPDLAGPDH